MADVNNPVLLVPYMDMADCRKDDRELLMADCSPCMLNRSVLDLFVDAGGLNLQLFSLKFIGCALFPEGLKLYDREPPCCN